VLDQLLGAKHYAAITVVHSETSTGARNDVREIVATAKRHRVFALVDSVSGLGGAELRFDDWNFDYVLTGSQKALALPPGLAFAAASASFIEAARHGMAKGVYFDLVEHEQAVQKRQVPNTPAISLYYALEQQLGNLTREGMPARWQRHLAMSRQTWEWVGTTRGALGIDLRVLAPEAHRSPTVSTIVLPASVRGDALVAEVAKRGFTLGGGYGKLKDTTFRIGHMGDHTAEGLSKCLDACAEALRALTSKTAT
jgi:aspartate aminotransferase-like enzyme